MAEEEEDDGVETIMVVDEEGNELECALLAVAALDGVEYALLAEVEELDDEQSDTLEMLIFVYEEDEEGNVELSGIDDEATFEKVRDLFAQMMEESED
jgi:uncharacterized protein YrzB (UPF0473 family)